MNFEPSFFKEEIRSDFLVTEKTKKIWAVELQLLERFDEVCKKHGLVYYAYYGTLLGAVRHHGFIPWDNDIDVAMFRNDYEKFQVIAPEEFSEPYFFQNFYTDGTFWPFAKIRDNRTTAIEILNPDIHQGIFIDIFPLDDVPDNVVQNTTPVFEIQKILWLATLNPDSILRYLQQGKELMLSTDILVDFLKMDQKTRFKEFEAFNLSHFGQSRSVDSLVDKMHKGDAETVKRDWFQKTEYLPFENMLVPVPSEYDRILTQLFGDYQQFVQGGSAHEGIFMDPDIPYKKYFESGIINKTTLP